jgi:hypothetical protein
MPKLLLCLPALAAATLLVASGGSSASAAPEHSVRLSLVEHQVGERFLDTGKRGVSPGDRNIVRSRILDTSGRAVGRADIDCVVTGTGRQLGGLCDVVITLPDGQLVGEFAFDRSGSSHYQAITGGTRRYAGMRGQAIIDTGGSDTHEPFTVELSR